MHTCTHSFLSGRQLLQQFVVVFSEQVLSAWQHNNKLTAELMWLIKYYHLLFIELSELNLIFARTGKFDLEITTFQMAVLFCWENRREDKLSLENLRLATELPDAELRKTLWSLVAFPKLKRQVLLYDPSNTKPTEWNENTVFWINQVQLTFFTV